MSTGDRMRWRRRAAVGLGTALCVAGLVIVIAGFDHPDNFRCTTALYDSMDDTPCGDEARPRLMVGGLLLAGGAVLLALQLRRERPSGRALASWLVLVPLLTITGLVWRSDSDVVACGMPPEVLMDGQRYTLQDQGEPGPGVCDHEGHIVYLGYPGAEGTFDGVIWYDCVIRNADGATVATTRPNRPDGTCGQQP